MQRVVLIILLFWLPFAVCADAMVYVTGMRITPAATKTVFVFDLTAKTTGKVRYLSGTKTLILKFENAGIRFHVKRARLGNANVTEFSAEERPDKSVEFYFKTTGKVTWATDFVETQDATRVHMRLEINSANAKITPAPAPQEVVGQARLENSQTIKPTKTHIFTVIIDPGHGGKDTGAVGKNGAREKDVVLGIAKKLVVEMKKIPGVRVLMTRNSDHYVPLRARLNLARRGDADLFIAVHADAYFNNDATGASVYALSQHGASSEASRWLVRQEKYSELDGIDFDNLSDRSRMVRSVLIDLSQTATIRDSLRLGNRVLDALDRISSLHYKHVEQAPFVVLKSPDIPSILIETGFISNPQEEAKLRDPAYQDKLARAICQGVRIYMKKYAGR